MGSRFIYSHEGHMYSLVPEYKEGVGHRIWVTGCEMYSMDGEYIGYWYRTQMPYKLILALNNYIKLHVQRTVIVNTKSGRRQRR